MKKQFFIAIIAAAALFTACNTGTFAYYDDIYTSSNDEQYTIKRSINHHNAANESAPITYYEETPAPDSISYQYNADGSIGTTYYYNQDDYYDYYYTSRLRRFHTDIYSGWGYYDPYFTNMYWFLACSREIEEAPLYQKYAERQDLTVAQVSGFYLNDTVKVDVVILVADDTATWNRLKEEFDIRADAGITSWM